MFTTPDPTTSCRLVRSAEFPLRAQRGDEEPRGNENRAATRGPGQGAPESGGAGGLDRAPESRAARASSHGARDGFDLVPAPSRPTLQVVIPDGAQPDQGIREP